MDIHQPAVAQGPQVTVTLVPSGNQYRVVLQSNIPKEPGSWLQVATVLLNGVTAAIQEERKEMAGEEKPRIVVPALGIRGLQ